MAWSRWLVVLSAIALRAQVTTALPSCDASASCSRTSLNEPTPLDKTARTAIVGGGVAGLSAAETLVQRGYENVVVLEAGGAIVPISHAVSTPKAVYDLDLVYVPALSWSGGGVEPRFDHVLRAYDADLIPVTDFLAHSRDAWHANKTDTMRTLANGQRVPVLHNYLGTTFSSKDAHELFQEIQRFYHLVAAFFQRHQYDGVHACLRERVALPAESFREWALRHTLPQLYGRISVLLNLYGNFPVGSSPACQVLMVLANKVPSVLGPGLLLTSAQPEFDTWVQQSAYGPLPAVMTSWLAQIQHDLPAFMRRFQRGYATLFASIVRMNRIDYRTHSRVQGIAVTRDVATDKRSLRVDVVGKPSIHADYVIVAARPDQAYGILPSDHPMRPLYGIVTDHARETTRAFGVYGVAVVTYEVAPDAGLIAGKRFVIDHVRHQLPMVVDRLAARVNVMRLVKTTDERTTTVVFQTARGLEGDASETRELLAELALYGFANMSVLQKEHYAHTPTRVPASAIASGWYDAAQAAQGHDGAFFVGETFSGHGVPTAFLHTRDWCVRAFNLSASPTTTRAATAMEQLVAAVSPWVSGGDREMHLAATMVVVGGALLAAWSISGGVAWVLHGKRRK